jgi:hypothetical protein
MDIFILIVVILAAIGYVSILCALIMSIWEG